MTDFDKLPKGGEEISVLGYKGILTRATKVAGGLEVTVQLNDEDDETPISGLGAFSDEEAGEKALEDAKNSEKDEEEEKEEEVTKPAPVKPVAHKPVANKSTQNK